MPWINLSSSGNGTLYAYVSGIANPYTAFKEQDKSYWVESGAYVTIKAEPYDGYTFDYIDYPESGGVVESGYSFTMRNKGASFSVEFYKDDGDNPPPDDDVMWYVDVIDKGTDYLEIEITADFYMYEYIEFWVNGDYYGHEPLFEFSTIVEINGLSPNTDYNIEYEIWDRDWEECYDRGVLEESTESLPYSFDIIAITDTTVSIRVNNISVGDGIYILITEKNTGSSLPQKYYTVDSLPFLVTNIGTLIQNTDYIIDVKVRGGSWIGKQTFTTKKTRPLNWSWTPTIASEAIIQLTAEDWNNFTSRINEFRKYKGLTDYTFIKVNGLTSNAPSLISTGFIHPARTAISQISGHGANYLPPEIKSGDQITASIFNGLKDALNAIP